MILYIGDQNLSSWSMRAWLSAKASGLKFKTVKILLDIPGSTKKIRAVSPAGKVPALKDGKDLIWDSLAIAEYLAEKAPKLWPSKASDRALARSLCAEMHSGFVGLRSQCSMDIQLRMKINHLTPETIGNINRICEMWRAALKKSGGPYLFGKEFGNADAYFTPVVFRFIGYGIDIKDPVILRYMSAIQKNEFVQEWVRGAKKEKPYRPRFK